MGGKKRVSSSRENGEKNKKARSSKNAPAKARDVEGPARKRGRKITWPGGKKKKIQGVTMDQGGKKKKERR